jgi:hypothetical protein
MHLQTQIDQDRDIPGAFCLQYMYPSSCVGSSESRRSSSSRTSLQCLKGTNCFGLSCQGRAAVGRKTLQGPLSWHQPSLMHSPETPARTCTAHKKEGGREEARPARCHALPSCHPDFCGMSSRTLMRAHTNTSTMQKHSAPHLAACHCPSLAYPSAKAERHSEGSSQDKNK